MKKLLGLALALALVFSLSIPALAEEASTPGVATPLDLLEFTLPDGVFLRQYSDSQETFVREDDEDGPELGGVFLLEDYEEEISQEELEYLEPMAELVRSVMKRGRNIHWS